MADFKTIRYYRETIPRKSMWTVRAVSVAVSDVRFPINIGFHIQFHENPIADRDSRSDTKKHTNFKFCDNKSKKSDNSKKKKPSFFIKKASNLKN